MEYIVIDAKRQAYDVEGVVGTSITAGELIEILEDFDENTPVILSHDGGYTFGGIKRSFIHGEDSDDEEDIFEEEEEEEFEEDDSFDECLEEDYDCKCECEEEAEEDEDEDEEECLDECDDNFGEHENSYDLDEAYSFNNLNDNFGGKTLGESLRVKGFGKKKRK